MHVHLFTFQSNEWLVRKEPGTSMPRKSKDDGNFDIDVRKFYAQQSCFYQSANHMLNNKGENSSQIIWICKHQMHEPKYGHPSRLHSTNRHDSFSNSQKKPESLQKLHQDYKPRDGPSVTSIDSWFHILAFFQMKWNRVNKREPQGNDIPFKSSENQKPHFITYIRFENAMKFKSVDAKIKIRNSAVGKEKSIDRL